jgi:hypothetical protein
MTPAEIDDGVPWAITWTAEEPMERSSHALAHEGRVWLIDPYADEAALRAAVALGEIAAVVQLLDRHPRHCEEIAERFSVPHLRLPEFLPDSPFEVHRMVWKPRWRELCLWWEEHQALVVAESVGTSDYMAIGGRPVGVHPMLRLKPPDTLSRFSPESLFVGHGPTIHADATPALREALARSRKDIPRVLPAMIKTYGEKR